MKFATTNYESLPLQFVTLPCEKQKLKIIAELLLLPGQFYLKFNKI